MSKKKSTAKPAVKQALPDRLHTPHLSPKAETLYHEFLEIVVQTFFPEVGIPHLRYTARNTAGRVSSAWNMKVLTMKDILTPLRKYLTKQQEENTIPIFEAWCVLKTTAKLLDGSGYDLNDGDQVGLAAQLRLIGDSLQRVYERLDGAQPAAAGGAR